jgi:LPS export ABC transporter protein LptC
VLAILAAASWVATWPTQKQDPPTAPSDALGPLGYYVRGARMLGTDEQGRVTVTIRAERLEEVPNANRVQLQGVAIDYAPVDETAWKISAASGSTPKDGSLFELTGDVEIRSVPANGSRPRTILTQGLRFWPETSTVKSDQRVEFHVGDLRLRAIGLAADLKGDTLRLESQVNGTFFAQ